MGRAVAFTLQEQSIPLIVIDKDEKAMNDAEDRGLLCL